MSTAIKMIRNIIDLPIQFFIIARERGLGSALNSTKNTIQRKTIEIKIKYYSLRFGETIIREVQGSKMELDVSTHPMKSRLILDGELDPITTGEFRQVLQALMKETSDPILVFELGAHHGYYSLLAANILGPQANIYAVEPDPRNIEKIRRNKNLNNYNNINIIEAAVGESQTQVEIHISDRSYKNRVSTPTNQDIDNFISEVYSFDKLFVEHDLSHNPPVVIRMDTEYYEREVIAGMSNLLQSSRDVVIFGELHHSSDYNGGAIIQTLEEHGFSIEILESESNSGEYESVITDARENNKNIEILARRGI